MKTTRGFTLVELLVSISIGLVVVGALAALYLSTARSYRQLEALGQLQSNARYVFEIMGYDIRMAGNMTCQVPGQANPTNFITNYNAAQQWWSNTDQPLFGYEETADSIAQRAARAELRKTNSLFAPHPDTKPDKKERRKLLLLKSQQ